MKYPNGKVESLAGRYHHPSRAAGFPGSLPVLHRNVTGAVATALGLIAELHFKLESVRQRIKKSANIQIDFPGLLTA
jgi:hypothetical protein